jgi:hypothetical protein
MVSFLVEVVVSVVIEFAAGFQARSPERAVMTAPPAGGGAETSG